MNVPDATISYRVGQLEEDVRDLNKKLDRLTWAIVGLTITIASSAIIFALTVASVGAK